MHQISHVIVFLSPVWFVATARVCQSFFAPCSTRYKATSVALIFLAELSLAALIAEDFGVTNCGTNKTGHC